MAIYNLTDRIPASGGTITAATWTKDCITNVSASTTSSWITTGVTSDKKLTFSAGTNPGTVERTYTVDVTYKAGDDNCSQTLMGIQSAPGAEPVKRYIHWKISGGCFSTTETGDLYILSASTPMGLSLPTDAQCANTSGALPVNKSVSEDGQYLLFGTYYTQGESVVSINMPNASIPGDSGWSNAALPSLIPNATFIMPIMVKNGTACQAAAFGNVRTSGVGMELNLSGDTYFGG